MRVVWQNFDVQPAFIQQWGQLSAPYALRVAIAF